MGKEQVAYPQMSQHQVNSKLLVVVYPDSTNKHNRWLHQVYLPKVALNSNKEQTISNSKVVRVMRLESVNKIHLSSSPSEYPLEEFSSSREQTTVAIYDGVSLMSLRGM